MSIRQTADFKKKKKEVINAYPTYSWEYKVNHMTISQILAIWNSLQCRKKKERDLSYKQISLFELYPEVMK